MKIKTMHQEKRLANRCEEVQSSKVMCTILDYFSQVRNEQTDWGQQPFPNFAQKGLSQCSFIISINGLFFIYSHLFYSNCQAFLFIFFIKKMVYFQRINVLYFIPSTVLNIDHTNQFVSFCFIFLKINNDYSFYSHFTFS